MRKRIDRGKKKSKMAKRLVEIRSMVGEVVVVEVVVKVKVVVCSQFVTHGGGKGRWRPSEIDPTGEDREIATHARIRLD